MSNTFPSLKKKKAPTKQNLDVPTLPRKSLPSALPGERTAKPCAPAQEMPSGPKPAVSETTNKVISFH